MTATQLRERAAEYRAQQSDVATRNPNFSADILARCEVRCAAWEAEAAQIEAQDADAEIARRAAAERDAVKWTQLAEQGRGRCGRCGGTGKVHWARHGGICYECTGAGHVAA